MSNNKIRVLVVDDSALMRRIIQNTLSQDPEIEVVGIAKDGIDAIEKARTLNPDVITLDIEMPLMDGISCLEHLLKNGSYAIIMVSSFTKERANATIRALELGAFDFITKSSNIFDMSSAGKQNEIIEKTKLAFRSLRKQEALNAKARKKQIVGQEYQTKPLKMEYIIAIGISTGGPKALSEILSEFPSDLPAAFVVVQHMPPGFTASLANRLNDNSSLLVKEAEDMDVLKAGHVYIAPGDNHLTFIKNDDKIVVKLNKEPAVGGFRPSVDVMMTSLSLVDFSPIIGVIMTGMGSDGSKGLKNLKENKNAYVIAQDEASSIVFGMPRSAIEKGLVDITVPLQEIPTCIMNYMGVRR